MTTSAFIVTVEGAHRYELLKHWLPNRQHRLFVADSAGSYCSVFVSLLYAIPHTHHGMLPSNKKPAKTVISVARSNCSVCFINKVTEEDRHMWLSLYELTAEPKAAVI